MLYFMRYTQKGPAQCRCLRANQKVHGAFTARATAGVVAGNDREELSGAPDTPVDFHAGHCYKHVCVHCSPPAAGAEEDKYQRVSRQVGRTLRSADHHILEDLTDNLHHDVQDGSPFAKDDAVTTTQPT